MAKRQNASEIQKKIKEIQKKEPTSVTLAISGLDSEKQADLLVSLTAIEQASEEKIREERRKEDVTKAEEAGRFIGKLKERLNTIKHEELVVKTRFISSQALLQRSTETATEDDLVEYFKRLCAFVSDLNILQCMANYKQGEVVAHLKNIGYTTELAAKKLDIPPRFAERLFTFFKLASKFQALQVSGYSFETLLKFKKTLEQAAKEDVDFCAKVEMPVTISFEGQDDDILLDDATGGMEKMQAD